MKRYSEPSAHRSENGPGSIAHLRTSFGEDSASLLEALREGSLAAASELYDKYERYVRTMLVRILGPDDDLPDLVNEAFYQILRDVHSVRNSASLKAWVARTTVFVAKGVIRKRKRRRWLVFTPDYETQTHVLKTELDEETLETARSVRIIVSTMSVDDQLIFTLRFFEELEITELAEALGVSRATVKRKLAKCEVRFKELAMGNPLLARQMEHSPKWKRR